METSNLENYYPSVYKNFCFILTSIIAMENLCSTFCY